MRPILVGSLFFLALTSGCTALSDSEARSEIYGEDFDSDNCKIEGSVIGKNGYVLDMGTVAVTFSNWVAKPGSPGEYLGFTATVSGTSQLVYTVKAGTAKYISDDTSWMHPSASAGANAISNVDFCECENPEPDGDDDGGSNDGSQPIFL